MKNRETDADILFEIMNFTMNATSINVDFFCDGDGSHFGLEYIYFTDSETKQ